MITVTNIITKITNATKISNIMDKRFKKDFLRKKSYLTNLLLKSLNGKKYRGVVQTKFTIYNWFYGRNENELLESELIKVLQQEEPEEICDSIFETVPELNSIAV